MDQRYQVLFSVPVNAFGLLIGKNGGTLKYICRESGASLTLQHFHDLPKGTVERVMILDMIDVSSFLKAYDLIVDKLKIYKSSLKKTLIDDVKDEHSDSIEVIKWLVNQSYCGLLIGRSGEKIKKIREISGAWVKIAHIEESVAIPNGDRLVYIRGTAKQNAIALDLVKNLVGGLPYDEVENESSIVQPQKVAANVNISNDIKINDKITKTIIVPIIAVSKIFGTEDGIDSNLIVLDCLELILTVANSVNVLIHFGNVHMGDIFIEVLITSSDEKELLGAISNIESKLKVWEEISNDKMFSAKVVVSENCVVKLMDNTNNNVTGFFNILDGEDKCMYIFPTANLSNNYTNSRTILFVALFQDLKNILTQFILLLHTLGETNVALVSTIPTTRGTKNYCQINTDLYLPNVTTADPFIPRIETFDASTLNVESYHNNYGIYSPVYAYQPPAYSIVSPQYSTIESSTINVVLESPFHKSTYKKSPKSNN